MAPKHYKVGPGKLTLGATSGVDFSAQVTSCTITPNATRDEPLHVLSGEVLAGDSAYTATLAASLLQDLTTSGIVAYSWTHAGETVDFEYQPNTALGATIVGTVVVDPISVGGEVNTRATSEISWTCDELPVFEAGTAGA